MKKTIEILNIEFKNLSYYGNPSYYVFFKDNEGNYGRAYTQSNAMCGYRIKNYLNKVINVFCHYTKKNNLVIEMIEND